MRAGVAWAALKVEYGSLVEFICKYGVVAYVCCGRGLLIDSMVWKYRVIVDLDVVSCPFRLWRSDVSVSAFHRS